MTALESRRERGQLFTLRGRAVAGRAAVLVGLLLLWQVLAATGVVDEHYSSSPKGALQALWSLGGDGATWSALGYTGVEILISFVASVLVGSLVGILLGLSQVFKRALLGPVLFLMSMPKVVFLPMFLLYFGVGQNFAAAFGAFQAFFYVTVNVLGGVELVQARHLRVGRAYGAKSWQRVAHIVLPSALPGIYAALWQGIHESLSGVLIAELFASTGGGIGQQISTFTDNFQTDNAVALMAVISVVAILVASVWSAIERRTTRWASDETVTR